MLCKLTLHFFYTYAYADMDTIIHINLYYTTLLRVCQVL
jgi:hypothetical protein